MNYIALTWFIALLVSANVACGSSAEPVPPSSTAIPLATPAPTSPETPTAATSTPDQSSTLDSYLATRTSHCIWRVAQGAALPPLPDGWEEYGREVGTTDSLSIATPAKLRQSAEDSVSSAGTLHAYTEALQSEYINAESLDDILSLHRVYCGELWQGEEATEVTNRNDVISALAECIWRVAHSDELPDVPASMNLSPEEFQSIARVFVEGAMAAYWLDEEIRADLANEEFTLDRAEALHYTFCGRNWGSAE